MNYFFSIFIRGLSKEKFYSLIESTEKFTDQSLEAEKDLIFGQSKDISMLSCILKLREGYPEARFGFSQYIGLAKGLSKIAKLGEVLISEEIEQQVIESFDITSLGMLSIEGMSSQILVYQIEQPVGEMKFPKQRHEEITIYRKHEAEALQNLLRVSNAVLVVGNKGSGKTAFLNQVTADWDNKEIYRTFCPSYSLGRTLKPITDIANQILGVHTVKKIEEKQRTIEEKLRELEMVDIGTSYLAILDFLGSYEEESILEKLELKKRVEIITECVAEVVKRISWNKPVVIIIEDIENMDASSVNFMQHLMEKLVDENICFIFSSSVPQVNISGLKEFELRGIDIKQLETLIEKVTGESIDLPPTTPFHVNQYLQLYREEKMQYFYNQYSGEAALTHFGLPFHDTTTIIKRRVELLEESRREFLFSLAIAGVDIYSDELPIEKKYSYLFDYFVERKYLERYLNNYIFASTLLHNEIYNLIPDKKGRHVHLADYYRRIQGFEEQAAFHYLQAENYKKALEYLMKSARLAIKKGGYESGINYYTQALELCQRQRAVADLDTIVAINEGLADIYRTLGEEDKALKYYKVVLDSYKEILKE